MKFRFKAMMIPFVLTFLLIGCSASNIETNPIDEKGERNDVNLSETQESVTKASEGEIETESDRDQSNVEQSQESALENGPAEGSSEQFTDQAKEEIKGTIMDYQTVKPDESKEIMVIMYHNLSDKNSEYGRTIESFKQDLERLYNMGFRTISMNDYLNNNITTEAGFTPVVLTFDDGHATNFKYLDQNGELVVDPDSVVGILDEFAQKHPDFGRHAIFFLNYGNAFGQSEYLENKLNYLLDNGYEIGNHAYSHEDLSTLDSKGIQTALGKNAYLYHQLNSKISMRVLALPYGKRPKDEFLRENVQSGEYEGYSYINEGILLVGWRPTYPVYHVKFDNTAINRVQSGDGEMQLTWWLDQYEKTPSKRYISDGNPDRISVPAKFSDQVDANKVGDKDLYFYELETE